MEAIREIDSVPRPRDTRWWTICIVLALGIHAAAAAVAIARWSAEPDQVANAPLIMVELETLPVAPDVKPTQAPPGPQQQQAAAQAEPPKPVEKKAEEQPPPQKNEAQPQPAPDKPAEVVATVPATPQAEPEFTAALPPKPQEKAAEKPAEKPADKAVEKKHRPKHASLASAPSPAEKRAARAAAPAPGAASQSPSALPNWKSELVARLERAKRYPPEAQARGEHGVAQLAFSVDRSGGVHHARIARSSGSSLLDSATLTMVERAAPMPPPPSEMAGAQIAVSVPIRYNAR
jgi:periplasmic protein TonB